MIRPRLTLAALTGAATIATGATIALLLLGEPQVALLAFAAAQAALLTIVRHLVNQEVKRNG